MRDDGEYASCRTLLDMARGWSNSSLAEGAVMSMVLHSSMQAIKGHAFFGGMLFSLGMFLLALAKPRLGQSTPFPFLGRLTLGIYVAHVFVMYPLTPFV